jgi:hypothetical protein
MVNRRAVVNRKYGPYLAAESYQVQARGHRLPLVCSDARFPSHRIPLVYRSQQIMRFVNGSGLRAIGVG